MTGKRDKCMNLNLNLNPNLSLSNMRALPPTSTLSTQQPQHLSSEHPHTPQHEDTTQMSPLGLIHQHHHQQNLYHHQHQRPKSKKQTRNPNRRRRTIPPPIPLPPALLPRELQRRTLHLPPNPRAVLQPLWPRGRRREKRQRLLSSNHRRKQTTPTPTARPINTKNKKGLTPTPPSSL